MMSRWEWLLLLFARQLWLRVTLFALAAVATAAAGIVFAPYVPDDWTLEIGAKSIDGILTILASSMLAVTVFSVSTMVSSAYGAATSNVTPRATKLLMEDNTSKNVLGTFIGSFIFSLVGIIALSTGAYGEQGRAILLVVTIGLIVLIAGTLLRWIDYLSGFGRLGETIDRVERATWHALKTRCAYPHLGGRPLGGPERDVPKASTPIFSDTIGYIQHVDVEALNACAKKNDGQIIVMAPPGTFVDPSRPLAMMLGADVEEMRASVEQTFTIGTERTYDQDPRFGLCVLAEIASRALSPAVNDPGTAIDVIGRAVRLLVKWSRCQNQDSSQLDYPLVWVPGIQVGDMFDDIFGPIARDGAGLLEIQVRLQKAFFALLETDPDMFGNSVRRYSATAQTRSDKKLNWKRRNRRCECWLRRSTHTIRVSRLLASTDREENRAITRRLRRFSERSMHKSDLPSKRNDRLRCKTDDTGSRAATSPGTGGAFPMAWHVCNRHVQHLPCRLKKCDKFQSFSSS